jgi:hypothetical protein
MICPETVSRRNNVIEDCEGIARAKTRRCGFKVFVEYRTVAKHSAIDADLLICGPRR